MLIPRHSEFRGRANSEAQNGKEFHEKKVLQNSQNKNWGICLIFFIHVILFNTVHLPPIRYHCVRGCWDRTQASCDYGLGCLSDALAARLHLIRYSATSHPHSATSHPHSTTSHPLLGYISSTLGYISSTLGYISSTLG
jgi:hypothetical protein